MRLFAIPLLLLAVFLTGCDALQGPPGPPGPTGANETSEGQSGDRLRRLFRATADGGRTLEAWYDDEIGVTCAFLVAADGDERCLPTNPRAVPIRLLYTDDACSLPVAFVEADAYGTLPAAFSYRLPGSFGMRARRLSYNVGRPDSLYSINFVDGGPICVESPVGDGLFYQVEPELSPSAFIAGTVEID